MKKFNNNQIIIAMLTFAFTFVLAVPINVFAATSPTLGTVGSYSVLGHTTVTNTGPTTMLGDLGISTGGAPIGFPPGSVGPPGTIRNAADSLAAQNANTAAFGFIDQSCDTTYAGAFKDLVGLNLVPGVYCADAFQLSGTLTLSGSGVWIFKSASTLTTSGEASVVGGDPCNVWWRQVSSATLGTNTSLTGNVLSSTSISLETGASLNGRALAQTGAVTLDDNTITGAACLIAASFSSSPSVLGSSSSASATVVPKLPNTGYGPSNKRNDSSNIIVTAVAFVVLASSYLVRRKRAF